MIKSNKGFTLVELIVVIAILAILAGVAIPVYNGYIQKANDAAVVTELDAIATAAQAANATAGSVTSVKVTSTTIEVTGATADKYDSDFVLYYPDVTIKTGDPKGDFTFKTGEAPAFDTTKTYENGAIWYAGDQKDDAGKVTATAGWNALPKTGN